MTTFVIEHVYALAMKLAEWARWYGIHPQTAYRWFHAGTLPVPAERLLTGTIIVHQPTPGSNGATVVYARVSSHDHRDSLDAQVGRVTAWATANGVKVDRVITEVGSGLDGQRPQLKALLSDPEVSAIVVARRDRLARFGVEHLEAALSAQGRKLVAIDHGETDDDLVRDMIDVLTSFSARLYGRDGARNRAMRAVTAARKPPNLPGSQDN